MFGSFTFARFAFGVLTITVNLSEGGIRRGTQLYYLKLIGINGKMKNSLNIYYSSRIPVHLLKKESLMLGKFEKSTNCGDSITSHFSSLFDFLQLSQLLLADSTLIFSFCHSFRDDGLKLFFTYVTGVTVCSYFTFNSFAGDIIILDSKVHSSF